MGGGGGGAWGAPPTFNSRPCRGPPSSLLLDHQMGAAVLRPARLAVVRALRLFLAIRDDRDAPGLHALRGEVVLGGLRAALAQREGVRPGAPPVAGALGQPGGLSGR